jgi:hypothetical protein
MYVRKIARHYGCVGLTTHIGPYISLSRDIGSRYQEYWFSTTDLNKVIAKKRQTYLTGAKKQYSG